MKAFAKILAYFTNICNYGAGIGTAIICIGKFKFLSVFLMPEFLTGGRYSYFEPLFFNLILFQIGVILVSYISSILGTEGIKDKVIDYPVIFMIVPVIVSIIGIIYGVQGTTTNEKIFVIVSSIVYSVLSFFIIYFGTKTVQYNEVEKDNE